LCSKHVEHSAELMTETINISTFIQVTQAGHGLAVGNVVYRASGGYAKALADAEATSAVVGIVATVVDASTFTLALQGHKINGLSGFTNGDVQYLSDSVAGGLTTTAPTSPSLAVPVAVAIGTTSLIVGNMLGQLVYDPLTQDRPDSVDTDLSQHYFGVYDNGQARSERADGTLVKTWLASEFDALGAAAAALVSANAYTDASVVGLFDDRGNWDASGNLFPSTGGSGTAGAILKGDVWRVSVAGTLGGEVADVGDSFRALVNTPGQTAANWALFAANTQQATESVRGTLAIATNAEAIDQASTNDIDAVTPVKWWAAFTSGVTFATAPAALLTSIRSTLLTGLSVATSTAVAATDSILVAFGKLQAFNNLFTTLGLAIARLANFGAVGFIRINADNTATARTAAEMRTDLGGIQPTIHKPSTTSRVNNTLTADPDLQIALAANQKISGTMTVYISASAAGDFKYRLTGPAGFTDMFLAAAWFTSTAGVTSTNLTSQAYDAADRTATAATAFLIRLSVTFSIDNGATPGTFALEWAQNTTSAGNPTTVLIGSQIQYISF
jgi:hypothetical protein